METADQAGERYCNGLGDEASKSQRDGLTSWEKTVNGTESEHLQPEQKDTLRKRRYCLHAADRHFRVENVKPSSHYFETRCNLVKFEGIKKKRQYRTIKDSMKDPLTT